MKPSPPGPGEAGFSQLAPSPGQCFQGLDLLHLCLTLGILTLSQASSLSAQTQLLFRREGASSTRKLVTKQARIQGGTKSGFLNLTPMVRSP